jgi:hypothetical protein
MNRNMLLLNSVLLLIVGTLGFTLRERWLSARQQDREMLQRQGPVPPVLPPPPLTPFKNVTPAQYFEVADRTLFSKDRNPTLIADPPPPLPPAPPMPDLPYYHGEMAIGEPIVLLSTAKTPQRSYRAGESIGEFKVIRFDRDTITFDWKGKTVERRLAELRPKETPQTAQSGVPSGAPAGAVAATGTVSAAPVSAFTPAKAPVTSLNGTTSTSTGSDSNGSLDSMLGPELSPTERACVEGDSSAAGTVHSGYRKVSMITLLGPLCHWEKQP